jgi:hypothetical protein
MLRDIIHTVPVGLFMVCYLFVLLRLITWLATDCAEAISADVAMKIVSSPDVAPIDHWQNEGDAETAEA